MSRHALDREHSSIHVDRELTARSKETGERLWKEQKDHHDGRYRPEHDPVECHHLGTPSTIRCTAAFVSA